jgi:hypothetical protein
MSLNDMLNSVYENNLIFVVNEFISCIWNVLDAF